MYTDILWYIPDWHTYVTCTSLYVSCICYWYRIYQMTCTVHICTVHILYTSWHDCVCLYTMYIHMYVHHHVQYHVLIHVYYLIHIYYVCHTYVTYVYTYTDYTIYRWVCRCVCTCVVYTWTVYVCTYVTYMTYICI